MNRDEAFRTLEILDNSSQDKIRSSYRRLAAKHHPDHGGDAKSFARLQEAHELLTDVGDRETTPRQQVGPDWMPGVPPKQPKVSKVSQSHWPSLLTLLLAGLLVVALPYTIAALVGLVR